MTTTDAPLTESEIATMEAHADEFSERGGASDESMYFEDFVSPDDVRRLIDALRRERAENARLREEVELWHGEYEAESDIRHGRVSQPMNGDELIQHLETRMADAPRPFAVGDRVRVRAGYMQHWSSNPTYPLQIHLYTDGFNRLVITGVESPLALVGCYYPEGYVPLAWLEAADAAATDARFRVDDRFDRPGVMEETLGKDWFNRAYEDNVASIKFNVGDHVRHTVTGRLGVVLDVSHRLDVRVRFGDMDRDVVRDHLELVDHSKPYTAGA